MLSFPLWVIVLGAVIFTSAVSGVFGMAGGMILMLILAQFFAVAPAMVLHGVTQFFSNGWRAVLWRQWISWKIVALYVLGALPALLVPVLIAYVPDKPVMLILLGLVPFAALALPQTWALDATKPLHAIVCGFAVAGTQLLAGVAGPLLDVFFVRSNLDRRAVVATKAATQALSHLTKIGYYGAILNSGAAIGWDIYTAAIAAAFIGTTLAGPLLEKLSNTAFRRWTKIIVCVVGAISIVQGVALMMG